MNAAKRFLHQVKQGLKVKVDFPLKFKAGSIFQFPGPGKALTVLRYGHLVVKMKGVFENRLSNILRNNFVYPLEPTAVLDLITFGEPQKYEVKAEQRKFNVKFRLWTIYPLSAMQ